MLGFGELEIFWALWENLICSVGSSLSGFESSFTREVKKFNLGFIFKVDGVSVSIKGSGSDFMLFSSASWKLPIF